MMKKKCNLCRKIKKISDFFRIKGGKYGVRSVCKKCHYILSKEYYLNHKKHLDKYYKDYRDNHKEEIKKYHKNHYLENLEKIKKYNKSRVKIRQQYDKERYEKIKNKRIKEIVDYRRKRLKTDKKLRIEMNLRSRIYTALKGKSKSLSTMLLIGCDIDYLMYYIQERFTKGMTWDNYGRGKGKWNIDHIKPCASFDLAKKSEQFKYFNYKNLQPLWAIDNIRKKDK